MNYRVKDSRLIDFYYRKTTTSGSGPKKGSTSVGKMTSTISYSAYHTAQEYGVAVRGLSEERTGLATIWPLLPATETTLGSTYVVESLLCQYGRFG